MPSRCARLLVGALVTFGPSCSNGESAANHDASRSSVQPDLIPVRVNYFEVLGERWLQLGLDYCGTDYRLEVQETAARVDVLVEAPPPGEFTNGCGALAAVILDEPLGDRRVANARTGNAISQINPE